MTVRFGLCVPNFTPSSIQLTADQVVRFAHLAEQLEYQSLWAWDHLFLGARRAFPFLESLMTLALLARETESVTLGTGVLVLPLRDPVVLAKQAATLQEISGNRLALGLAAGWYEREFEATGVDFRRRGRVFEEHFEVITRLWSEEYVTGTYGQRELKSVRMLPQPAVRPKLLIGGYVDRVLRRIAIHGDGWLTYFYTAESASRAWGRIRQFAEEQGRDPDTLTNVAQLPICVDRSRERARSRSLEFIEAYFDVAEWSESTPESAICGSPEDCAEQIQKHLAGCGKSRVEG